MDEAPETLLKMLCCTCLSKDRKLVQLTKIKDGINSLYSLLSLDSDAYQECFYRDITSLFMCWECSALIRRLKKFRHRACIAQKLLSELLDGKIEFAQQGSLSKLTINKLISNENIVIERSQHKVDLIDDGCSLESNLDNIPLKDLKGFLKINKDVIGNEVVVGNCDRPIEQIVAEKNIYKNHESDNDVCDSFDDNKCSCGDMKKCKCSKEFQDKADLDRNSKDLDVQPKLNVTTKLETKRYKRKKRERDKTKQIKFKCRNCGKCFETKSLRDKHSKRAHNEGFACSVCGKRYPFKYNLLQHERQHEGPLPREECAVCRKMIRIDLVKAHARIHEDRQSYVCLKCDKTYVSKASYENHLKFSQAHAVTDVLKHKCSVCEKGYRSRGELRDHVNYQHLGASDHKCPICSKPLATRRCITRHIRRAHQNIKENARDKICQKCGKAFRYKKSLKEHELIHTGEKPLSCVECGRKFRQSAALYTHCRRVHSNTHTSQTMKN